MAPSMPAVEERVDRLEDSIDRFITSVGIEFNKLYNSQMRTEAELRSFKDDMSQRKDEWRQQNREMNRKWDAANKLGTIVEDLVAPSLARIIDEKLGQTVIDLMIRRKRRLPDGRVRELDALAITA